MTNVTNFTDKLMELMPDGAPDDSVREAVALVELVTMAGGTPDESDDYIKINTDRQYRLELKTGVSLDARRRGRKSWENVMASPAAPSDLLHRGREDRSPPRDDATVPRLRPGQEPLTGIRR